MGPRSRVCIACCSLGPSSRPNGHVGIIPWSGQVLGMRTLDPGRPLLLEPGQVPARGWGCAVRLDHAPPLGSA